MTYISQPISQKLEKLGVKSESEKWWVLIFQDEPWELHPGTLGAPENRNTPAYTLSDILNPDNLKKLFGDGESEIGGWKWCGQQLLKYYWIGGLEVVEKYLEKEL